MLRVAVADPSVTLDDPSGFLHDPIGYLVKCYHRHGRAVTPAPGRDDFVFALGPDYNQAIYQQPDLFVATGFLFPGPRNSAQRRLLAGLFNLNGEYHALDNVCLHRGGPLSDGAITGCIVTCPWHGWQYDLTSGTLVQDPTVGVRRHETRIVGDEIQVRLTA